MKAVSCTFFGIYIAQGCLAILFISVFPKFRSDLRNSFCSNPECFFNHLHFCSRFDAAQFSHLLDDIPELDSRVLPFELFYEFSIGFEMRIISGMLEMIADVGFLQLLFKLLIKRGKAGKGCDAGNPSDLLCTHPVSIKNPFLPVPLWCEQGLGAEAFIILEQKKHKSCLLNTGKIEEVGIGEIKEFRISLHDGVFGKEERNRSMLHLFKKSLPVSRKKTRLE